MKCFRIFVLGLVLLPASVLANIVSYTDKNGVVRYTNRPVPEQYQQDARVVVANGVFISEAVTIVPPAIPLTSTLPVPPRPAIPAYQPPRPASTPSSQTLSPEERYLEVRPYSDYLKRPEKRSWSSTLKQLFD